MEALPLFKEGVKALPEESTRAETARESFMVYLDVCDVLDGKRINHLINRREYYYTYRVKFINSTSKVRFGMLIKTLSGFELGGASLHGYTKSVEYIAAQQTIIVKFKFKCLLNPGVYFLNAGVVGMADDHLTYLSRCIDIAMFRVQHYSDSCGTGVVDFLIEPSLNIKHGTLNKQAEIEYI